MRLSLISTCWSHLGELWHFNIKIFSEWSIIDLAVINSSQILQRNSTTSMCLYWRTPTNTHYISWNNNNNNNNMPLWARNLQHLKFYGKCQMVWISDSVTLSCHTMLKNDVACEQCRITSSSAQLSQPTLRYGTRFTQNPTITILR
jgi:hypothetical protein